MNSESRSYRRLHLIDRLASPYSEDPGSSAQYAGSGEYQVEPLTAAKGRRSYRTAASATPGTLRKGSMFLSGLVVVVTGLHLCDSVRSANWPHVTGEITGAGYSRHTHVLYSYSVPNDQHELVEYSGSQGRTVLMGSTDKGSSRDIYYNPTCPKDSMIYRPELRYALPLFVMSLMLSAFGLSRFASPTGNWLVVLVAIGAMACYIF